MNIRRYLLGVLLLSGCDPKPAAPAPAPQAAGVVAPDPDAKLVATIREDLPVANVAGPVIVFGPDGRRVAYIGSRGGSRVVVVDGEAGDEYSWVGAPVFSPDGAHLAYRAEAGKRAWVVLDGVKQAEHLRVSDPVFIAGNRLVYAAEKTNESFERTWTVEGAISSGPRPGGFTEGIRFSGDGRRVVVRQATAEMERRPAPGGEVLWTAEKWEMRDYDPEEKVSRKYDEMSEPVLSPDGRRLAYRAADAVWARRGSVMEKTGSTDFIVVDGEATCKGWEAVSSPVFSPDGKQVACLAKKGGLWCVLLDGERIWGDFERLRDPIFSPDGSRIACRGSSGTDSFAVVDGVRGPAFVEVGSVVFEAGGDRFAYTARTRDGGRAVVIGDKACPQQAEELWPPVFVEGECRFGLRRGRDLFVKTIRR